MLEKICHPSHYFLSDRCDEENNYIIDVKQEKEETEVQQQSMMIASVFSGPNAEIFHQTDIKQESEEDFQTKQDSNEAIQIKQEPDEDTQIKQEPGADIQVKQEPADNINIDRTVGLPAANTKDGAVMKMETELDEDKETDGRTDKPKDDTLINDDSEYSNMNIHNVNDANQSSMNTRMVNTSQLPINENKFMKQSTNRKTAASQPKH